LNVAAKKSGEKAESTEAEPMEATTNGAAAQE